MSTGQPDWHTTGTPLPEFASPTPADRILHGLQQFMTVVRAELGDDAGQVIGKIHEPLAENVAAIKEYLSSLGCAALFRPSPRRRGEEPTAKHLIQFGPAAAIPARKSRPWVNIVLFLLTVLTTLAIGSLQQNSDLLFLRTLNDYIQLHGSGLLPNSPEMQEVMRLASQHWWNLIRTSLLSWNPLNLGELAKGIPFSFALLLILGSHELGHYLTARRYGVDATLPYFLPIPHPLMGTMGAFIRIKSPIPNRRALVRLGVAGPLVGFLVSIPIVIIGLKLSRVTAVTPGLGNIAVGSSLLFGWLSQLFFPKLPPGQDVFLHPLASAGWLGFFVTALNLLPVGQLDGGHVAYVALGRFRKAFQFIALGIIAALGILWPGWILWGVLVLVLGMGHPPTQDEITPLRRSDWLLVAVAVAIFVLAFIPVPFPRGTQ
jgi:hypothetical protein